MAGLRGVRIDGPRESLERSTEGVKELRIILPNARAFADPAKILAVAEAAKGLGFDTLASALHVRVASTD